MNSRQQRSPRAPTEAARQDRTIAVLLTATVSPRDMPFLTISNPEDRLAEYCGALSTWATLPDATRIVWCDNSGYDGSEIRSILHGARCDWEILRCPPDTTHNALGKGYGEMTIIRYALERSRLLEGVDIITKVTGRYSLLNANTLLRAIGRMPDVEVVADLSKGLSWADSRVFGATRRFLLDHLLPLQGILNDSAGFYFEHALARAIHSTMAAGRIWAPLPVSPRITGRSGTTGLQQQRHFLHEAARAIMRRLRHLMLLR